MSEAGGIGEVVAGTLAVREAERSGVSVSPCGHEPEPCLNCGALLAGPYCSACGQAAHVHRTVAALGHDFLHGVFHFEGKLGATLPLLVRRPGELTRRYIGGERAKFVSPMALFLFSVFLLFAAISRIPSPHTSGAAHIAAAASERGRIDGRLEATGDRLEELAGRRRDARTLAAAAELDRRIAAARAEMEAWRAARRKLPAEAGAMRADRPAVGGGARRFAPAQMTQGADIRTGIAPVDSVIADARANPELYAYKLKMASYKFSWALIPISLPFIWLLFSWRRDVGLYDHAIFAIYSLAFMTLLAVGLIGLSLLGVPEWPLWTAMLLVPPIHMFKQLRGAYRIGHLGASWRTAALLAATTVSGALFFVLLLWLETE